MAPSKLHSTHRQFDFMQVWVDTAFNFLFWPLRQLCLLRSLRTLLRSLRALC